MDLLPLTVILQFLLIVQNSSAVNQSLQVRCDADFRRDVLFELLHCDLEEERTRNQLRILRNSRTYFVFNFEVVSLRVERLYFQVNHR